MKESSGRGGLGVESNGRGGLGVKESMGGRARCEGEYGREG